MRTIRTLLTSLVAAAILVPAAARAAEDVDLLLVLAVDVSRSIDATKFQLQREGYAAAVADPHVLEAIRTGRTGRIGLTFVEWSGVGAQKVVIDWTTIGGADSAKGFGDRLLEAPRSFADRTSISGAIEFAMGQFDKAPYEAAAKGITINGLVILSDNPMSWNPDHTNPPGGLANYYRSNVVGGPSAFVMVAENFNSFGQAIIKKMIAEVAQAHEPRPLRAAAR